VFIVVGSLAQREACGVAAIMRRTTGRDISFQQIERQRFDT
jgi:hypothetical protein